MTFVMFFRSLFIGAALIAASTAVVAGQKADIIDTAKSAGNFTTLVAAIEAEGLTDTLKGKGPFTVFAPTDEAFTKLPAGAVEALLKEKEKLTKILRPIDCPGQYLIVPGSSGSSRPRDDCCPGGCRGFFFAGRTGGRPV